MALTKIGQVEPTQPLCPECQNVVLKAGLVNVRSDDGKQYRPNVPALVCPRCGNVYEQTKD